MTAVWQTARVVKFVGAHAAPELFVFSGFITIHGRICIHLAGLISFLFLFALPVDDSKIFD